MKLASFYKILSEIAKENGYSLSRVLDNVFELKKGNKKLYFRGRNFGLNSALSSQLCSNKGQTYAVLKRNNLPVVPHFGIYNPETYNFFGDQKKRNEKRENAVIKREGWPLVVKPAEGSSGIGVELISRKRDLKKLLKTLFIRNDEVVLSPFRVVEHEYRVIVLNGKVELIFDKIRTSDDFRHNLCLGAKSKVLTEKDKNYQKLEALAKRATKALKLEFSSVDIVETTDFGLEILEVNSSVSLSYFGAESKEKYQIAKSIYKKAFKKAVK